MCRFTPIVFEAWLLDAQTRACQTEPMKVLHCVVRGRVQGVGFRYFVMDEAKRIGVNGWVRNLPDGDVELEAKGTDVELQEFLSRVRQGPALSRVDQVLVDWREGGILTEGSLWGMDYRF